MIDDIRVLSVNPLSDAGVSSAHLAEVADDFSVLEAQTTDEALDMMGECHVDCVLSAYTLPESDGIELLRVVRGTWADLPFVLYTESGSERIASEAISAGVSDYLRSEETDAETLAERAKQLVHPSDTNGTNQRFNHYRSIVQAMGDGVYTLDTNGYMTAVNDSLVDISGYERDELLGRHVSVLLAEEDVRRGARHIKDLLDGSDDVGQLQAILHTADGRTIPCEARIGLLVHDDAFRGTVGVFRSIEEHEHVKKELRDERRRIEELHEVASEMETCRTTTDICELTVEAAENILQFIICGVDLVEHDHFVPAAISTGMTDDGYTKLRTDEGIAGKTHQNGETYVLDDVRTRCRMRSRHRRSIGPSSAFPSATWASSRRSPATSLRSMRTTPNWPNCCFHTPWRRFGGSVHRPPSARARRSIARWSNRATTRFTSIETTCSSS